MRNEIKGQQNTIVRLPRHVANDPFIKEWRLSLKGKICPLVVENEAYHFSGLARKLFCSRHLIYKMRDYGILVIDKRSTKAGRKKNIFCTIESIANLISWAFKVPCEDIIISEKELSSQAFLRLPYEERLKILFNAYSGCFWMDHFLAKLNEVKKNAIAVKIWQEQQFNGQDLEDLFVTNSHKLKKMGAKGFLPIMPDSDGTMIYSQIQPGDLAILVAYLHDLNARDILAVKGTSYYEKVAENFIKVKLQPYLHKHQIKPQAQYSLAMAAKIAGKTRSSLYAVAYRKRIKNVRWQDGQGYLLGIDLAIYILKHGENRHLQANVIKELFGCPNLVLRDLGIKSYGYGQYYSCRIVFAAYDRVAEIARRKLVATPAVPKEFKIRGETFILSADGQRSYCSTYSLRPFEFNPDCLEHLKMEIKNGKRKSAKEIATKDLLITMAGNEITKVKLK